MQFRATLLTLLALAATSLYGQSAFWSPPSGTLQKGKANMIELHLEDCSPTGLPSLPNVTNLQIELRNRASSQSTFNGRVTFEYILTYAVTPQGDGPVAIPAFEIDTNEGRIQVPEARYEIVAATVGNTGARPEEIFTGQLASLDGDIYEGEVFEIQYVAGVKQGYQFVELGDPDWKAPGLVTSGLKQTQEGAFEKAGQRYIGRAYVAEAMATDAGSFELPSVSQSASIVVGRRRGFPFDEPIVDSYAFESEAATISVKPLPSGAPASFRGAVGDFSFASRVVPEEVRVGEPITWTLELAGSGNWPAGIGVPPRQVAASFRAIQPDLKNEFAENSLFEATQTEDIVLIPTTAGRFELGPVEFTFFDPEEARYITLSVPAQTVVVAPAAAPPAPTAPESRSADTSAEIGPSDIDLSPAGENLSGQAPALPREPIAASEADAASARQPAGFVDTRKLLYAAAAPLALWLALAAGQALRLDPARPRRQARAELRKLARETPRGPEEIRAFQLRWRAAARQYLGLTTDEPAAQEIAAAAPAGQAAAWRALWQDSDRFLFAASAPAFEEWKGRFAAALDAAPKTRRSLSPFLSARAWAPALGLSLLAFALASDSDAAPPQADPEALYLKGDFARAGSAWRSAVQAEPNNWTHRYNAGLAASQQGKWGEAWAWWASAYALEPGDPRLTWNLKLAHTKTGAYYATLVDLVDESGVYAAARLLSPAGWESFARYAAVAAGVLFCLGVLFRYIAPFRRLGGLAFALGLAAGVSVFAAQWLHGKYELLAEPQAMLAAADSSLRAAPTDLGEQQSVAPLREGSVGLALKRFLGWVKLELPNGDVGWTRAESLIPLYGAPDPADS